MNTTGPIIELVLNNKQPLAEWNRRGVVIFYRKGLVAVTLHCVNHTYATACIESGFDRLNILEYGLWTTAERCYERQQGISNMKNLGENMAYLLKRLWEWRFSMKIKKAVLSLILAVSAALAFTACVAEESGINSGQGAMLIQSNSESSLFVLSVTSSATVSSNGGSSLNTGGSSMQSLQSSNALATNSSPESSVNSSSSSSSSQPESSSTPTFTSTQQNRALRVAPSYTQTPYLSKSPINGCFDSLCKRIIKSEWQAHFDSGWLSYICQSYTGINETGCNAWFNARWGIWELSAPYYKCLNSVPIGIFRIKQTIYFIGHSLNFLSRLIFGCC